MVSSKLVVGGSIPPSPDSVYYTWFYWIPPPLSPWPPGTAKKDLLPITILRERWTGSFHPFSGNLRLFSILWWGAMPCNSILGISTVDSLLLFGSYKCLKVQFSSSNPLFSLNMFNYQSLRSNLGHIIQRCLDRSLLQGNFDQFHDFVNLTLVNWSRSIGLSKAECNRTLPWQSIKSRI